MKPNCARVYSLVQRRTALIGRQGCLRVPGTSLSEKLLTLAGRIEPHNNLALSES